jgi:hypothetical protein
MRSVLKFLAAIVFIQALTAALVFAITQSENLEFQLTVAALCFGIGALAAFWLSAISAAVQANAMAKAEERYARGRERLKVKAEKEKIKLVQENHRTLLRERHKLRRKSDVKAATSFAGMIGLGALLVFSQFVTFGLLLLATGGGAAGGYMLRLRQERGQGRSRLGDASSKVTGLLTRKKNDDSQAA